MTLSPCHVAPPLRPPRRARACAGPPVASHCLGPRLRAKTLGRLWGDQAGIMDWGAEFSVPGSTRAVDEFNSRTQIASLPFGVAAAKATRRPSGDTARSVKKRI